MQQQSDPVQETVTPRRKVAYILAPDRPWDKQSRVFDLLLMVLISLNVVAVIVASVDEVGQNYRREFFLFEVFSVVIFTIEYLARVWSSPDIQEYQEQSTFKIRCAYMFSPMALVDLIAILPFYMGVLIPLDLRFLRILRILRIFKLTRYSAGMQTLLSVIKEEANTLVAAFFIMFILMTLAASGIYLIEKDIQPEAFGSIPAAMWWSIAALTTVGYGDVTPITPLGKVFGSLITIIGVGMVALPTGIMASGFANTFRRQRLAYEGVVRQAWRDGVLSPDEASHIAAFGEEIGISQEDAELILKTAKRHIGHVGFAQPTRCTYCGAAVQPVPVGREKPAG